MPFVKKPGFKRRVAVLDVRLDAEGARGVVDRWADVGDLPIEHAIGEGLDPEFNRLARPDERSKLFLNRRRQLQRMHLHDGATGVALADVLARLHETLRNRAGHRSSDLRVVQLLLCELERGATVLQRGLEPRTVSSAAR